VTEGPARDVVMMALRWAREEFIANNPWPFLVGEPVMTQPRAAMKTLTNVPPALRKLETLAPEATPPSDAPTGILGLVVAPIRKRQQVFPEMITLGRTANNDVVIPDATVSKFHAYFRATDKGLELVDAGSRNGTKVMGRPLSAKLAVDVAVGTRVRFGNVDLVLRDAGDTWDTIRRRG
jgi:pSer/pThr/pTyr-binding forkhead associated (FHA) protein